MGQTEAILEYMRQNGSITPLEALHHCGCFRLGARIFDLKDMGIPIETVMVYENQNGKRTKYARYWLREKA